MGYATKSKTFQKKILFPGKITLHDLKRCRMANVFFDTFFNIEKYLDHEQKDQFSVLRVRTIGAEKNFVYKVNLSVLSI